MNWLYHIQNLYWMWLQQLYEGELQRPLWDHLWPCWISWRCFWKRTNIMPCWQQQFWLGISYSTKGLGISLFWESPHDVPSGSWHMAVWLLERKLSALFLGCYGCYAWFGPLKTCHIYQNQDHWQLTRGSLWLGYTSQYGDKVLSLLKNTNNKHQHKAQTQCVKTRVGNKKCKIEDLERDAEQQELGGSTHSSSTTVPLVLVHTQMINPIIVKCVGHPARLQPSCPHPQPTPIIHPYIHSDVFDSLMGSLEHM